MTKTPPDPNDALRSLIWNWLLKRIGKRPATVVFIAAFLVPTLLWFAWQFGPAFINIASAHWPLPLANPNVFTVAIIHLDNDDGGQIEHDIAEGLKEVKGIDVLEFNRAAISDANVNAGNALARKYLERSKAQVLIWGTVLKKGSASETPIPKLYWTASAVEPPRTFARYPLAQEDLSLPPAFTEDLNNLLRLLIVTQGTAFYGQQGHFIAAQLTSFIQKVDNLLVDGSSGQEWKQQDIARIRLILAFAQTTLGEQNGQNQPLRDAVANLQWILLWIVQENILDSSPIDWTFTEMNLGIVLADLGERESGTEHLLQAVAAFQAVLQVRTPDGSPLAWAATEDNLGIALTAIGERESGTEHLRQAVKAFRAVQLTRTRDRSPLDWAETEVNLGTVLGLLSERESGTKDLEQAVESYQEALQVCPRDQVPLFWAATEDDLGIALMELGEQESRIDQLQRAVAAFQEVLQVDTRVRVPLEWAKTENNLGIALMDLSDQESGKARTELLLQSIAASYAALHERKRERVPLAWAMTEVNLGSALYEIGEVEDNPIRFCDALHAELGAWEAFVDSDPYDAAKAANHVMMDVARLETEQSSISDQCLAAHAQILASMILTQQ